MKEQEVPPFADMYAYLVVSKAGLEFVCMAQSVAEAQRGSEEALAARGDAVAYCRPAYEVGVAFELEQ